MNFERELEKYTSIAETALKEYLPKPSEAVSEAMAYSVSAGGKRLRPVLLLSSAEAFGKTADSALPFAAAIEMIHTYSLIHDDLPAMDDDDYRRGKPSCHIKYGEANAILAGDALLNRAYEIILNALGECSAANSKSLCEAARIIADGAGINGMVAGQAADIFYENKSVDEKTLLYINERKTGALIAASFKAGALIGGADSHGVGAFWQAGMKVGAAFQIRDDVLDACGSLETLGKPIQSDKRNNKETYFSLLGPLECSARIERLTSEAAALLRGTSADTGFLVQLIMNLTDRAK